MDCVTWSETNLSKLSCGKCDDDAKRACDYAGVLQHPVPRGVSRAKAIRHIQSITTKEGDVLQNDNDKTS
jgi:hypothetical protein